MSAPVSSFFLPHCCSLSRCGGTLYHFTVRTVAQERGPFPDRTRTCSDNPVSHPTARGQAPCRGSPGSCQVISCRGFQGLLIFGRVGIRQGLEPIGISHACHTHQSTSPSHCLESAPPDTHFPKAVICWFLIPALLSPPCSLHPLHCAPLGKEQPWLRTSLVEHKPVGIVAHFKTQLNGSLALVG